MPESARGQIEYAPTVKTARLTDASVDRADIAYVKRRAGQPTAGEFYELTAIAAVVLGGAALTGGEGTLYKSVIGVFIMIVLGNALNLLNVDSYWQRVAVGAVIIAAAAAERLRSQN